MMLIRNIIKPIFPKAYYPYNKLILEYLKSIALLSDDKIYKSFYTIQILSERAYHIR